MKVGSLSATEDTWDINVSVQEDRRGRNETKKSSGEIFIVGWSALPMNIRSVGSH